MSDWNPEKYLLFKNQRTQPAVDLAMRVKKYCPKCKHEALIEVKNLQVAIIIESDT